MEAGDLSEKLTVPEFKKVAFAYAVDHMMGGSLHIVVDDGNLEDPHVEWCLNYALEQGDSYGAALALLLLHMTKSQRGRISKSWYDWHDEGRSA